MSDYTSTPAPARTFPIFPAFTEILDFIDRILEQGQYSAYVAERLIKRISVDNPSATARLFLDSFTPEFVTAIQTIAAGSCSDAELQVLRQALSKAYAVAAGEAVTEYSNTLIDMSDISTRLMELSCPKQSRPEVQAKKEHLYRLMSVLSFMSPTFPARTIAALLSHDTWDTAAILEMSVLVSPTVNTAEDSMEILPEHLQILVTHKEDENETRAIIPDAWLGTSLGEGAYRTMLERIVAQGKEYIACGSMEHTLDYLDITEGGALVFTVGGGNNSDTVVDLMVANVTRGRIV